VLVPVFLIDVSDWQSTGFFGTLNQVGIASGFVVGYAFSSSADRTWRVLAGIGAAIPALLTAFIWLIPEPQELPCHIAQSGLFDSLTSWSSLRDMVVAVGLMFFQQGTGINIVLAYGIEPNSDIGWAAIIQLSHVISCIFGAFFIDRIGRRMMWTVSLAICALTDGAYACTFIKSKFDPKNIRIVLGFIFLFAFGLGGGPIPWFFVPERFAASIRARAASIIAIVNWIFAFAVIAIRTHLRADLATWTAPVVCGALSLIGAVIEFFMVKNPVM
jgi:hypothetical protein